MTDYTKIYLDHLNRASEALQEAFEIAAVSQAAGFEDLQDILNRLNNVIGVEEAIDRRDKEERRAR